MYRVVVIPADTTGCGTYRMIWPAQAVKQARPNWTVDIYEPHSIEVGLDRRGKITTLRGIDQLNSVDLIVLQRLGKPTDPQLVHTLQTHGITVVVDSDDAMWCIDRENYAHKHWEQPNQHWRNLDQSMSLADLTTVTTDLLSRRYGKHGRTVKLPNCVPGRVVGTSNTRDQYDLTYTLGWVGFTKTHPRDLTPAAAAVQKHLASGGKLRVIGDATGAAKQWGVPPNSVDQIGPYDLDLSYYAALSAVDVGLVPLENNQFNHGKSYLKALEYAAVGVPVVASPTPANRELARTVPIILADNDTEWVDAIELLSDPNERKRRSAELVAAVNEHHTYEKNAERWAYAWERAIARRHKMLR